MMENQKTTMESHTARVSNNYYGNAQTVVNTSLLPTEQLHVMFEFPASTTTIHSI